MEGWVALVGRSIADSLPETMDYLTTIDWAQGMNSSASQRPTSSAVSIELRCQQVVPNPNADTRSHETTVISSRPVIFVSQNIFVCCEYLEKFMFSNPILSNTRRIPIHFIIT